MKAEKKRLSINTANRNPEHNESSLIDESETQYFGTKYGENFFDPKDSINKDIATVSQNSTYSRGGGANSPPKTYKMELRD